MADLTILRGEIDILQTLEDYISCFSIICTYLVWEKMS